MSNLVSPSRNRPWYMMGHPRSGRNPFDSIGRDYCLFCKQDVEVDTEAHHQDGTYAYRRQCCRCGQTVNWGVYSATMLEGMTTGLNAAYQWVAQPGQDRS